MPSIDEIILVGPGGHANSCIDVIELSGQFKIAGLIDKNFHNKSDKLTYPIIGNDDDLINLRDKYEFALVTIGQIKSGTLRKKLFELLSDLNYKLPVIISPRSHVSKHCKIGDGTIIMHDGIVNANTEVGKNCIINTKALIEHDAIIGDHCHIATGVIVNGEVSVGSESFIGSGAVTKQSVTIGSHCIIGAGAVIKTDIESNQIIKG